MKRNGYYYNIKTYLAEVNSTAGAGEVAGLFVVIPEHGYLVSIEKYPRRRLAGDVVIEQLNINMSQL